MLGDEPIASRKVQMRSSEGVIRMSSYTKNILKKMFTNRLRFNVFFNFVSYKILLF